MGIKDLSKLIRTKYSDAEVNSHLSDFAYMKIAIDANIYLHKFKALSQKMLQMMTSFVSTLRRYKIAAIFIFDGKSPDHKQEERERRRETLKRAINKAKLLEIDLDVYTNTGNSSLLLRETMQSINEKKTFTSLQVDVIPAVIEDKIRKLRNQAVEVTKEDINNVKELVSHYGFGVIHIAAEAEHVAADLERTGYVSAVISEDTDVLAYGVKYMIRNINTSTGACTVISHDSLLKSMNLTYPLFLDFCIMCGCDYNDNMPKVGPVSALRLIKLHGSIEEIERKEKKDISCLKHELCRRQFSEIGLNKIYFEHEFKSLNQGGLREFAFKHQIYISEETYTNGDMEITFIKRE